MTSHVGCGPWASSSSRAAPSHSRFHSARRSGGLGVSGSAPRSWRLGSATLEAACSRPSDRRRLGRARSREPNWVAAGPAALAESFHCDREIPARGRQGSGDRPLDGQRRGPAIPPEALAGRKPRRVAASSAFAGRGQRTGACRATETIPSVRATKGRRVDPSSLTLLR
jgi:hypothetical protein